MHTDNEAELLCPVNEEELYSVGTGSIREQFWGCNIPEEKALCRCVNICTWTRGRLCCSLASPGGGGVELHSSHGSEARGP